MKHLLLTTIAAVLLVGCGAKPNYSGVYTLDIDSLGTLLLELKPDSSFIGTPQGEEDDRGIGSWKVEGDLLVCEGTTEKSSKKIVLKLNKTTLELTSMTVDGEDRRPPVPEGADGHYFKRSAPSPETAPVEPVAEAAKVEPSTAKAPEIPILEADKALQSFWFYYGYTPEPGYRLWERGSNGVWVETYPSGFQSEFKELERTIIKGRNGVVVVKLSGDSSKTLVDNNKQKLFISDYEKNKSLELYESIKSDSGKWSPWNKKTWPMKALATQDGKKHGNIHGSVISNDVEMLKNLLSSGINVNVKDDLGNTPLDYANDKMTEFLSNHGAKTSDELKLNESKLTASARDGDIQKVRSYLTIGVDVNSIDEDGHTMLHWNINPEIIELLIASGADINIISKHGRTALDFALMRKHKEAADLLRKHGGKTGEELKAEGK